MSSKSQKKIGILHVSYENTALQIESLQNSCWEQQIF